MTPILLAPIRHILVKRYWKFVANRGRFDLCWRWTGAHCRSGYGHLTVPYIDGSKRTVLAHRIAYFLHTGKEPGSLVVRHECDNKRCCNPNHLRIGTHRDNMQDAVQRGQIRNKRKKLSREQLFAIYSAQREGATCRELVERFGISMNQAEGLSKRRCYRRILDQFERELAS